MPFQMIGAGQAVNNNGTDSTLGGVDEISLPGPGATTARWRITGIHFQVRTTATVGNRLLSVQSQNGPLWHVFWPYNVAASKTAYFDTNQVPPTTLTDAAGNFHFTAPFTPVFGSGLVTVIDLNSIQFNDVLADFGVSIEIWDDVPLPNFSPTLIVPPPTIIS